MSESPSPVHVREQLERLQASAVFEKSGRLMVFLRHIVEAILAGQARQLTESGVGNAVYGQAREYDARIDSSVRVEARRLRRKLSEYYAGAGKSDPVLIGLPVGSYVPVISSNDGVSVEEGESGPDSPQPIFRSGPGAAVAVLPLRALSSGSGEESFAEGLTDELTFSLTRSPGLRVVARSATLQALKHNPSLPTLAADFALDAVVQGSVRVDDAIMRVTVEVSDPKGFIVWSDRIDMQDGERLRLQELTAATILSRVRFDSSQMRAGRIEPGPVALEAHGKVLSSRQLLDQQTPASLRQALEQFKQVALRAPDYARGHSGIADCYCDMYRLGLIDQATARGVARNAAMKALSIDAHSIEGRAALGTVCGWLEWNRFEAEEHFRIALRLGESSRAARAYGVLLTLMGRYEEAEHLLWESRQMEPFSIQQDIAEAVSCYQSRRFDAVIETVAKVPASRVANEALVHAALSGIFLGDEARARQILARIGPHVTRYPDLMHARAEIEALLGNASAAVALLSNGATGSTAFARATLAVAARDDARALEALKDSIARRELSAVWIRSDPRFDRLRTEPAFEAVIADLNRLSVDRFAPAEP